MMKKIIVTGANGYIGRNFIRYASEKNYEIYAIDISNENSILKNLEHVYLYECSLDRIENLIDVIPKNNYIAFYHFAWNGVASSNINRNNYQTQIDNIRYTCDAALLSKKLNCNKFITTGSIVEKATKDLQKVSHITESFYYGTAKNSLNDFLKILCNVNDINYMWVTLPNIYGGDSNGTIISYAMDEFENNRVPKFGPCLQPYNFTYIKDVVRGLLICGISDTCSGEYFLSNGECKQLKVYIEELAVFFSGKTDIGAKPDDGLVFDEEWFDNCEIRSLGFKPKYNFIEGIKDLMNEKRNK